MKETFGQRLARLRKEKNISKEEIAEKLGISLAAIEKWEDDSASPDISIILSLSDILGVTTDELLGKEVLNPEFVDPKGKEEFRQTKTIEISDDGEVNLHIKSQEKQKTHSKLLTIIQSLYGSMFLLSLVAYILMGVFITDRNIGWVMGWLVFFIPGIIGSLVSAIVTRKIHRFAYPILVTFVYLLLGFLGHYFNFNGWGVYWFLFITIPAFYAIVSPIDHYLGKK